MTAIQERLFALRDEGYRAFHCKLMPTVDAATVIGVRTPALRALAKELAASPEVPPFLAALPHRYYEENNLHGLLLEREKSYEAALAAVDAFLPYVDNWATCDLFLPKVFAKHKASLLGEIRRWLASGRTYTVRYGLETLMNLYLDEDFQVECLELAAAVRSEEYYVNMMIAWYFATALAKRWAETIPYVEGRRLDTWAHNKTIQKAVESYRITDTQKAYLKTLKIK